MKRSAIAGEQEEQGELTVKPFSGVYLRGLVRVDAHSHVGSDACASARPTSAAGTCCMLPWGAE